MLLERYQEVSNVYYIYHKRRSENEFSATHDDDENDDLALMLASKNICCFATHKKKFTTNVQDFGTNFIDQADGVK